MRNHGPSDMEAKTTRKLKIIIKDEAMYRQLLQSRGPDAQALLNMFQKLIDNGRLAEDRKSLIVATERLSRVTNMYPLGFELLGIKLLRDAPDAGGGYADIYQGERDGISVCLKWIRTYEPQGIDYLQRKYSREAIVWRQLSHPNVLPFLGLSHIQARLFLVSPWAQNGHVIKYLKQNPNVDRRLLCLDVASGLKYLHQNDTIHGDLKGANILVNESGRACVADFGLASVIDPLNHHWTSHSVTSLQGGTMNWQAPELFDVELSGPIKNTTASDVYAWACVCYEIFTGERPFFEYPINSQIPEMVLNGKRPSRPPTTSAPWIQWGLTEDIWRLMDECWLHDPMARPKVDEIVHRLEGQMQTDNRSSVSWGQIVLTDLKDDTSFPRALKIIDEILRHQLFSHYGALPTHYSSGIDSLRDLRIVDESRNPSRKTRWYRKSWIITLCACTIGGIVAIVLYVVKATGK